MQQDQEERTHTRTHARKHASTQASKQASKQASTRAQRSPASVGLAQARPNTGMVR